MRARDFIGPDAERLTADADEDVLAEGFFFEEKVHEAMQRKQASREAERRLQAQAFDAPDFLDWDQVMSLPDPVYLISDVLELGACGIAYGPSRSAKSFLTLDWSLCIAAGIPWNDHATSQGNVLYIAAEGVASAKVVYRPAP